MAGEMTEGVRRTLNTNLLFLDHFPDTQSIMGKIHRAELNTCDVRLCLHNSISCFVVFCGGKFDPAPNP